MEDSEKKISVLCLGPKGSGKTTLLKKLQDAEGIDNTYSPVPTIGTNIYDINYLNKHGKKQTVLIREVGGEMAPLWSNYLDGVEKIIFVVDTSNLCQISAAAVMLYTLLAEPRLKSAKVKLRVKHAILKRSTNGLTPDRNLSHEAKMWLMMERACPENAYALFILNRFGVMHHVVEFRSKTFILVLSKMDAAYRQMRNEALLMLQYKRLSAELPNAPTLLEAAPLQGEGLTALRACLAECKPPIKPTMLHQVQ